MCVTDAAFESTFQMSWLWVFPFRYNAWSKTQFGTQWFDCKYLHLRSWVTRRQYRGQTCLRVVVICFQPHEQQVSCGTHTQTEQAQILFSFFSSANKLLDIFISFAALLLLWQQFWYRYGLVSNNHIRTILIQWQLQPYHSFCVHNCAYVVSFDNHVTTIHVSFHRSQRQTVFSLHI